MRIRFLVTTASQAKGYPFMPGQIIDVPNLDGDVRRWLKYRHAEVLREEPESAAVRPAETAVLPSAPPVVEGLREESAPAQPRARFGRRGKHAD